MWISIYNKQKGKNIIKYIIQFKLEKTLLKIFQSISFDISLLVLILKVRVNQITIIKLEEINKKYSLN